MQYVLIRIAHINAHVRMVIQAMELRATVCIVFLWFRIYQSSNIITFSIITTTDVNECEEGTHTCHQNAVCINTNSSYSCSCKDGYIGNGTTCYGLYCVFRILIIEHLYHQFSVITVTADINECQEGTHTCHQNAICIHTNTSYLCLCKKGYTGNETACYGLCNIVNILYANH